MSMDEALLRTRLSRGRSAPSADISEDGLARDWTLSAEDLAEIAHARGPDHRRRFALQLCMLRNHGRFLDDYRQAPLKIVNHLHANWTCRRCCSSTARAGRRRNARRNCASAAISD